MSTVYAIESRKGGDKVQSKNLDVTTTLPNEKTSEKTFDKCSQNLHNIL